MRPLNTVSTRRDLLALIPKNSRITEVGVFCGEFSREILEVCDPEQLDLVDWWKGEVKSGDKDGRNPARIDLTNYDKVLARSMPRNVKVLKVASLSYLRGLPVGTLDAIYLDADHSYEALAPELAFARTRVRKGGWIMGHDYGCLDNAHDFSGVVKAVTEFLDREDLALDYVTTDDNCISYAIRNL